MARRGLIIALMAALVLAGTGRANAAPFAYITIQGSGTVVVIDAGAATPTAIASVSVGSLPEGVAVSPDGARVYIANLGSNSVSVLDATTTPPTVTATVAVGTKPIGVAVSPDGSRLYVTNLNSNSVSVINTTTNMVTATVGVGISPFGVGVSPDGSRVYVANGGSQNVSVIDATATPPSVFATVGVGISPFGLAVSPDGSRAYVANFGGGSVSVLDTTTKTPSLSTTVVLGNMFVDLPIGIAVSPNGSRVYVAESGLGRVSVIDTTTMSVTATVPVGVMPFGVAVTPDGSRVFVANSGSSPSTVSVIDATTTPPVVTTNVPVMGGPFAFGKFIVGAITTMPFASFTANANINVGDGSFVIHGTFTLGAGSRINPVTDPVTIAMTPFATTIAPGSFQAIGNGQFMFSGTNNNGLSLTVKISPIGASSLDLKIEGAGATLTGITSPVTVSVMIGNNGGSTVATTQSQ